MVNRKSLQVIALAVASASAHAGLYNFTYSDGLGNAAFGSLTTTAFMPGVELAVSGSITVTAGTAAGTYALIANPTPVWGSYTTSPSTAFLYDSFLMPTQNPHLTQYALLFGDGLGKELNIWGDGPGSYSYYGYGFGGNSWDPAVDRVGKFELEAVPEPFTMALGLAGLGAAISRRRRKA